MPEPAFGWDPAKSAAKRAKHGISFEEAVTVFEDGFALLIPDPSHSVKEDRLSCLA